MGKDINWFIKWQKQIAAAIIGITPLVLILSVPRNPQPSHPPETEHDTVYVKLVNGERLFSNTAANNGAAMQKNGSAGADKQTAVKAVSSQDSVFPPPKGVKTNVFNAGPWVTTRLSLDKSDTVRLENDLKERTSNGLIKLTFLGYVAWILVIIIIVAMVLWRLRTLPPKLENEKDPEKLEKLFEKYSSQISGLNTPRKIKRFSNKVRFQYFILNELNLLENNESIDLFVRILIAIEVNQIITKIKSDEYAKGLQEFIDIIKPYLQVTETDGIMVAQMFKLNKGNLI